MAGDLEALELLVLVANPTDYLSWSPERKLERCKRVMEWHDFAGSHHPQVMPYLWGTHQVLSHTRLSDMHSLLAAVYRVSSLEEFDRVMDEDPLRDISRYTTWVISPLEQDRAKDLKRFERMKNNLLGDKSFKTAPAAVRNVRSLYIQPPEYVGKYQDIAPPMQLKGYDAAPSAKLEVLVVGTNPPNFMDQEDTKQLISYEKVLWWADYIAMLIGKGLVSHAWNAKDFCDNGSMSGNSEAAAVVYSIDSFDEFGDLYSLDPLRLKGYFWSIVLRPIAEQRAADIRRVELAQQRYRL